MDTFSRRELFRRLGRAAIVGPVMLATRDQQADLVFYVARLFGKGSVIGRWLKRLWMHWY